MDLHKGMRLLSFVSFTIGVTVFVICGWTYISNKLLEESAAHHPSNFSRVPSNDTSNEKFENKSSYQLFRTVILRACVVVILVSIVQIASAGVVLWSPPQGARQRSKVWLVINVGINIILLICFILPLEFANGNIANAKFEQYSIEQILPVKLVYIESFYIGLTLNFVVHFLTLILCMVLLRNDVNKDYELVTNA